MAAFRLSRELLAPVFGLHDESGSPDDTAVSEVNERLELMFREGLLAVDNAIIVHTEELLKLRRVPGWKDNAKVLQTAAMQFSVADGIPDAVLTRLNNAPAEIAEQIHKTGRLAFCHAPQLHVEQHGKQAAIFVLLRVVYAPEFQDAQP